MGEALTVEQSEQEAKIRAAVQTCLMVKLRNDYSHLKAAHKANAAGNSVVNKLIKGPMTSRTRPLKETEPSVKDELSAMKEQPNAPNLKTNLCMVPKHVKQCWENESADVKEEILRLAREMREAGREAAKKRESPKVTDELIILRLTEILSIFFGELHKATGWTFSVLLSSPDPSNGAEAATLKETAAQSLKGQDLLHFSTTPDNILTTEDSPTTILPDISCPPSLPLELALLFPSVAPEADFFGNLPLTHQHNETGKESDLPILPMPEGYIPPPPPPPLPSPSTSMFFDLNFDSLDDAFCEMESQDAMMKMPNLPPRIHYQLDHLVWHSLPVLTTSSAPFMSSPRMSTMTPSLHAGSHYVKLHHTSYHSFQDDGYLACNQYSADSQSHPLTSSCATTGSTNFQAEFWDDG
ncbi:hypothetical protein EDB19DRAFT_1833940 [Suillus lakei]|nr:hypothetical protein EDB19DRAFT_1833940 [Suillus lakei]